VSPSAAVGENAYVGPNVTIEDGAVVGRNSTLVADVLVKRGAFIGDNVVLGYRDNAAPETLPARERLVTIGEGAKVRSGAVLYWGVTLGDRTTVGHHAVVRERTTIGDDSYLGSLSAVEGNTTIGCNVGIHTQCHVTAFCDIGDYTFIGPQLVSTNDNGMRHRRRGHGEALKGFTTGCNVRIAGGVKVLPGIRFGEGCVVGVGSVVTRDVPPYKVALGAPARVVRDAPLDDDPLAGDGGR
jgi:acetyltransferase-like isoleucine patch superfamily enzyme